MLCAKNLKVVLAAILGVVGLVGAGTAHAEIILVGEGEAANTSHAPQYFAAERLYAKSSLATVAQRGTPTPVVVNATSSGFNVSVPNISVALLTSEKPYFVRFDLLAGGGNDTGRVRFNQSNANTDSVEGSPNQGNAINPVLNDGATPVPGAFTRVQYLPGSTGVIFSMDEFSSNIGAGDGTIAWALPDNAIEARIISASETVTYELQMTIWSTRTEAVNGAGTALWTGKNSILLTRTTVSASASSLETLTTTVASNFRRFSSPSGDATAMTQGDLATVTVKFTDMVGGTKPILDHNEEGGGKITLSDVLEYVEVDVMGDNDVASYNFGNFYVGATCTGRTGMMERMVPTGTAPAADKVQITTALQGKIRATAEGMFKFCVNVMANTDKQQKYQRIEPVAYTMALRIKLQEVAAKQGEQTNLRAGSIKRDGTEVRIGYLTTATNFGVDRTAWEGWEGGEYNQRLVITNHGSVPATYKLGSFAKERGVTVEPTDMAEGTIAKESTVVMKVRDLITITGANRTSAVLTMAATESNVSVMTTTVTLPEGQTDTVLYHPR